MTNLYERYPTLLPLKDKIDKAIDILLDCYKNKGIILVCGNGGSCSDSAHILGELMKGFMQKRPLDNKLLQEINKEFNYDVSLKLQDAIPCIDLTSSCGLNTAFSNDVDADFIYAQQVYGYSKFNPFNVVIGLSTSGNSKNVVNAFKVAKAMNLKTIAFTGEKESSLTSLGDVTINVPEIETYKIQELHLPIYHYICQVLEEKLF